MIDTGHLDCDLWVPASSKFTLLKVKAAAKPRSNCSLTHEYAKTSEWKGADKDAKEAIVHKTTTKVAFSKGGRNYGIDLTSESIKATLAGNMLKGDWTIDGKAEGENKFAKADWKAKVALTCASPVLMEKMRIWTNADFETNKKQDKIMVMKQNIGWEKFNFGWGFEYKGDKFTTKVAHLVHNFDKDSKSNYWTRVNAGEETVGAGCMIAHGSFAHSYEAEFGYGEKSSEGFYGSPVHVVMGGDYKLSDKTNVDYTMRLSNDITYNQTVSHELNDKLSVNVGQAFDSANLKTKEPAHKLGFSFDYKL